MFENFVGGLLQVRLRLISVGNPIVAANKSKWEQQVARNFTTLRGRQSNSAASCPTSIQPLGTLTP